MSNIGYVKSIREKIAGAQSSIEKILSDDEISDQEIKKKFIDSNRCLFEALRLIHVQHGIFRTMQVIYQDS